MYRELRCIYCLLSWQVLPISLSLSSLLLHRTIISLSVCAMLTALLVSIMGAFVHLEWFPCYCCCHCFQVFHHLCDLPWALKFLIPTGKIWPYNSFFCITDSAVFHSLPFHRANHALLWPQFTELQSTHISISSNKTSVFSLQEIFVNVSKIMLLF